MIGNITKYFREIEVWIQDASQKLEQNTLQPFDFDVLRLLIQSNLFNQQRLLYLYAKDPHLNSEVIAWSNPHDPDPPSTPQERPYMTVSQALDDGWQIVHFPQMGTVSNKNETTLVGCEFILQKLEV